MPTPPEPDLSALASLAHELAITMARVVGDMALVVDGHGVIAEVAEGALGPIAGCDQWVGRRWIDTVSPGSQVKVLSLLQEVTLCGATTLGRELMHPVPGQADLPLAWSAIRLGSHGPVLAVGRDLRAVAALQQRFVEVQQEMERHYWRYRLVQSRSQRLYQVAHDAVLVLDAGSLVVLQANAASAELLGRRLEDLLHQPLTDSLPVSLLGSVLELLVATRSSGRAVNRRGCGTGPSGRLDMAAAPLTVDGRRQLMLRLRKELGGAPGDGGVDEVLALSRMAEVVETTADALVITDADGGVLMANPAFLRLTGVADESLLRRRLLPELMVDTQGAWAAMVDEVRRVGMVTGVVLEVGTPDGPPRRVRVAAALLAEGEPACIGFAGGVEPLPDP
ncbi:PAS domain-containing protein [Roseateles amylovorans]|uniref:PAS domain-containing protein n=1 Tax=Roseateles amylovorans TaxID=2978473 RepID=A0ABY6B067_9BURK|nr:PAS domain-containing protein [Roseateles amylovorans]UXH78597.1 PAS domain-containing protein [Roseateles amylovorans]